ncbi:hypothetical protein ACLKMH_13110 [Psychromonas sp. KJ10-10]|uniref:hypothetical protein n=1 Tax=Psychromonas sp. KJ10-10 TaxID=3391823 RepID=UPI0039B59A53
MTEYIILGVIVVFIYFALIKNKPVRKTDWESLPNFEEYQAIEKSHNEEGTLCCQHCGHQEMVERTLKDKKENPENNKFYHACTQCKVVLWRSQK